MNDKLNELIDDLIDDVKWFTITSGNYKHKTYMQASRSALVAYVESIAKERDFLQSGIYKLESRIAELERREP